MLVFLVTLLGKHYTWELGFPDWQNLKNTLIHTKYHQLILMAMCLFSNDITWKYGWCVLWNHRHYKKLPTGKKF